MLTSSSHATHLNCSTAWFTMVGDIVPHWSGIRMINPTRPCIYVHTDAKGIGGWYNSDAFSSRCPRRYRSKRIEWKEAYAVLFAFAKWGHHWRNHTVIVRSDNSIVVAALNSCSVRGDTIDVLQLILLAACLDDIEIIGEWISTQENWIADALSRFQLDKVANIFPQLVTGSSPPRRQSGAPMSTLRNRLQTSIVMDCLQELEPASTQQFSDINSSLKQKASFHFQSRFEVLSSWFAEMVQENSISTAEWYLASLKSHSIDLGLSIGAFQDDRLKRIIRDARRKYGVSKPRERKDITKDILCKITNHFLDSYDDINLKAAFCTFCRIPPDGWIYVDLTDSNFSPHSNFSGISSIHLRR